MTAYLVTTEIDASNSNEEQAVGFNIESMYYLSLPCMYWLCIRAVDGGGLAYKEHWAAQEH